jgi:hypothetical protein
MPVERKHISDLASFRYTPVKLVRSTKGNISPALRADVERQVMGASSPPENKSNRDTILNTKTDYSECK